MVDSLASAPVQGSGRECTATVPNQASNETSNTPKKVYWWEEPLLKKEQMTAEELARPFNPYYEHVATSEHATPYGSRRDNSGNEHAIYAKHDATLPNQDAAVQNNRQSQQLGDLHQRRAVNSPEKFDRGCFEPTPITTYPAAAALSSTGLTAGLRDVKVRSGTLPRAHPAKPPFSMLESLCDSHDVLLFLVSYLTLPDIINLYAISKRFHFLWNANYVAHIKASLRTWAPGADEIFPWACYKSLCIKDPYIRQKSRWVRKDNQVSTKHDDKRDVPSLRWLQMVVYRQGVTLDILIQMALKGLRCMPKTSDAVKRIWFLMDLPLNAHRVALMRSQTYMNDKTLLLMTGFMLKLDMYFTDPFGQPFPVGHSNDRMYPAAWAGHTFTGVDMRETLLAERGLTPLWRVLRGWSPDPTDPQIPMTRLDILRLWARHKYKFPEDMPEPIKKMSFMGVPRWQIGTARLERVGMPKHEQVKVDSAQASVHPIVPMVDASTVSVPTLTFEPTDRVAATLLGPEELVMLEGIRRRMNIHLHWLPMMAWGLHDGLGRRFPVYTEEQMNRMVLGESPVPAAQT